MSQFTKLIWKPEKIVYKLEHDSWQKIALLKTNKKVFIMIISSVYREIASINDCYIFLT